jgi:hypothetical protein
MRYLVYIVLNILDVFYLNSIPFVTVCMLCFHILFSNAGYAVINSLQTMKTVYILLHNINTDPANKGLTT